MSLRPRSHRAFLRVPRSWIASSSRPASFLALALRSAAAAVPASERTASIRFGLMSRALVTLLFASASRNNVVEKEHHETDSEPNEKPCDHLPRCLRTEALPRGYPHVLERRNEEQVWPDDSHRADTDTARDPREPSSCRSPRPHWVQIVSRLVVAYPTIAVGERAPKSWKT